MVAPVSADAAVQPASTSAPTLTSDRIQSASDKVASRDIRTTFRKTRLCSKHVEGRCRFGANCRYAHSAIELSSKPDLAKTKLCYDYFRGECFDSECRFAHGYEELRATDDVFKKELCHGWATGFCRFGKSCRFAHGDEELRNAPTAVSQASTSQVSSSQVLTSRVSASQVSAPQVSLPQVSPSQVSATQVSSHASMDSSVCAAGTMTIDQTSYVPMVVWVAVSSTQPNPVNPGLPANVDNDSDVVSMAGSDIVEILSEADAPSLATSEFPTGGKSDGDTGDIDSMSGSDIVEILSEDDTDSDSDSDSERSVWSRYTI